MSWQGKLACQKLTRLERLLPTADTEASSALCNLATAEWERKTSWYVLILTVKVQVVQAVNRGRWLTSCCHARSRANMSACFTHVQSDLDLCCKNGRVNLTQYTFASLHKHGKLRRGGNLTQYAGNQRRRQAKLHARGRGERHQPRCRSRMNRRFQRTPRRRPITHVAARRQKSSRY
jgi:hypothetical protein